jgi:hypothetical protein
MVVIKFLMNIKTKSKKSQLENALGGCAAPNYLVIAVEQCFCYGTSD